jgi:hypothetical protein
MTPATSGEGHVTASQRYFTIYNQHCTITYCKLTRLYETAQPTATELLKNMRKSRIYTGAL